VTVSITSRVPHATIFLFNVVVTELVYPFWNYLLSTKFKSGNVSAGKVEVYGESLNAEFDERILVIVDVPPRWAPSP